MDNTFNPNRDKILTIAIPTYNRASILKIALQKLIPQYLEFADEVELIITDNCSTDDTSSVINDFVNKYNLENVIFHQQTYNSGYYGNFRKCRELSNGKYFWLLSDNDHITSNTLAKILDIIRSENNTAFVYLHNQVKRNKCNSIEIIDFRSIKHQHENFSLMLISSIVVRNNKNNDDYIFETYKNNLFLGFLFLAESLRDSQKVVVMRGFHFDSYPSKVTFNIFEAWINHIDDCIQYMIINNIIDEVTKNYIVTGYLKRVVYYHVYYYIVKGNLYNMKFDSISEIENRMDEIYMGNQYYNHVIKKLFQTNRLYLLIRYLICDKLYKKFL